MKSRVLLVATTVVTTAVATVLLVALGAWWVGTWGDRPGHLEAILDLSSEIHPVKATEELCMESACVEGWKTDRGNFLRFADDKRAEHWATLLGDKGRRDGRIVLDMHSVNMQFEEIRYAIEVLYCDRDWY